MYLFILGIGLACHSQGEKASGSYNKETQTLSNQQKERLKQLFNIFYIGNKEKWAESKKEIFAMGDEARIYLCDFLIKFFLPGTLSSDQSFLWRQAQKDLVELGGISVPYIIVTMEVLSRKSPKIGSPGITMCSEVLSAIGKPAVPGLIENLYKGNNKFRRHIVYTLGIIGDRRATDPIIKLYQSFPKSKDDEDENYDIRYNCIKAIKDLKDERGLSLIEEALSDPSSLVRREAVAGAVYFRIPQAISVLKKALKVAENEFPSYTRDLRLSLREAENKANLEKSPK